MDDGQALRDFDLMREDKSLARIRRVSLVEKLHWALECMEPILRSLGWNRLKNRYRKRKLLARGPVRRLAGKQVAVKVIRFRGVKEPRLRFDRTAVAFVRRLQAALSKSVSEGKTVIVTITAPIRQDSKTGVVLANKIRKLLASRRAQLSATIFGNRTRVRVLKGGATRTSRLIGFVHNPEPNAAVLFDVTRSLLACMDSRKRFPRGHCWLIVANPDGLAPVETVRQVCLALGARTVFKRILLAESEGVRVL